MKTAVLEIKNLLKSLSQNCHFTKMAGPARHFLTKNS
ncbi:MAG: hypothetical protein RLZZ367_1647 [Bacteroidota bacterium]|jgi:hypothetical protein